MGYIICTIILFILYKIYQKYSYYKYLEKIPMRIHVNGSRGKSDVTRLIAAGLRGYTSGKTSLKVWAKTTGTLPRILGTNGEEIPIVRRFPVNIGEQMKIVKKAAHAGVDVLVIECMAVQPELQWVSENKMLQSQIGVITNARLDHLDVMGKTSDEVAHTLGLTIPKGGKVFTADEEHYNTFSEIAKERGNECILVIGEDLDDELLEGFKGQVFRDNLALALAVCNELGVPYNEAIQGMYNYTPDPGAFQIYTLVKDDKQIYFANAFAANDPESTLFLYKKALSIVNPKQIVGIYNHRRDRDFRSTLFLDMVEEVDFDEILWLGRKIDSQWKKRLSVTTKVIDDSEYIIRYIKSLPDKSLIFGFGNIKGKGQKLTDDLIREVECQ